MTSMAMRHTHEAILAEDRKIYRLMLALAVLSATASILVWTQIIAIGWDSDSIIEALKAPGNIWDPSGFENGANFGTALIVIVCVTALGGFLFLRGRAILRRNNLVPVDKENEIIALVKSLAPEFEIDRVLQLVARNSDSAIRGRTLILSYADYLDMLNYISPSDNPLPAVKRQAEKREARLRFLIAHEAYHQAIGEARFNDLFSGLVFVAATLGSTSIAIYFISVIATGSILALTLPLMIATIFFVLMVHRAARNFEIFCELRADAFARFQSGHAPVDGRSREWQSPFMSRSYPTDVERDAYLADVFGAGTRRGFYWQPSC